MNVVAEKVVIVGRRITQKTKKSVLGAINSCGTNYDGFN